MTRDRRFVILAEGMFGPLTSKTANSCIRYTPEQVVAVLDTQRAGRTVQDVLGFAMTESKGASVKQQFRGFPIINTLAPGEI